MNNTEITDRLDVIEKLLFRLVPWAKLDEDDKKRAVELGAARVVDETEGDKEARRGVLIRQFMQLANMTAGQRKASRFPRCLVPGIGEEARPLVPLSILINRCAARKCFALLPGEVSAKDNVLDAIAGAGLRIETLGELGVESGNNTKVVLGEQDRQNLQRWKPQPARGWDDGEDEEPEELETSRIVEVREAEPPAWGGIDLGEEEEEEPEEEEETFETSECAQGVATMGAVDEDDIVEDEDEDEDLSATTNPVDDDNDGWGPDEHEFSNPIREQFEREAEEAWAREQAALASGELILVDGIPVARKK